MAKLKHLELPNGSNYDIYGVNVQEISYDDYEALTPTQKNSDIAYCITDTPYEVDDSIYGEASGAIASFSDGSNKPLVKLEADINPIQDLHGYDKPWAGGAGKNLADKPSDITVSGVTVTVADDGTITINGTASSYGIIRGTFTCSDSTATYTWGLFNPTATNDIEFSVRKANGDSAGGWARANAVNKSFTFVPEATPTMWQIQVGNGATFNNWVCKPMIVSGSTAPTTYEPYANICPISGRSSVEVTVAGKNLYSDVFADYTKPLDYIICPIPLEIGKTYTAKAKLVGTAASGCTIGIAKKGDRYSNFGSFITLVNSSGDVYTNTITLDSSWTSPKLIVYAANETTFNSLFENYEIQLEVGSTATSYEPYNSDTETISLGQTVYGGKLNVTTGELTVDRAMVDLGTINWSYNSGGQVFGSNQFLPRVLTNGRLLCTQYEWNSTPNITPSSLSDGQISASPFFNRNTVMIKDSRYTDAATFKTAVSGVMLCYELETPTTVTLTPTQVSSLLGSNNIWADSGDVDVVYITSDFIYNELRMNDTIIASNSFAYHSIESESATMAGHANTASNAQTVNGHTVNSDVPSNATFTDTTYTFANGTNGFTVTPSGGTAQTVTVTPSISNNVTGSGTSGYLAKFNGANTITNGAQLGSDTTKFLRNDGTWAVPPGAGVTGNNAGYHNSIYRGKSLGTSITTAQWNAISAGTFDDMYIGDYWTLSTTIGSTTSNIQYVIAGFDYWWNCGDSYPQSSNKHHVVLVPATNLYSAQMNATDITTGGYIGSAMYTTNLANARTGISTLFGNHLYSVRRLFTNSVNTVGQATGWAWATSSVDLMSETMVYGHPVWTTSGFEVGVDRTILPLFALNSASASIYSNWWLRSVATPSYFALVSTYGNATYYNASTTHGVRPAFAIC